MKRLQISAVADMTFGMHRGRSVDGLDHEFVCVFGPNESGKSTLAEFLQWSIGGTQGRAAEAERFMAGVDERAVTGRLLGELDGVALEIAARFKILKSGRPNDLRNGFLTGAALDGADLMRLFGGLVPEDYFLIHRIRGAELVTLDAADAFTGLFSQFAVGSGGTGPDPRTRLTELNSRRRTAEQLETRLRREVEESRSAIASSSQRPEEIDALEARIAELGDLHASLSAEFDELQRQRASVQRARELLPVRGEFSSASAELDELEPVSDTWRSVVRISEEIVSVHDEVEEARTALAVREQEFHEARAQVGLPASAVLGVEFSLTDRDALLNAAQEVKSALAAVASATTARDTLATAIKNRDLEIRTELAALGAAPGTELSLVGREPSLRSLQADVGIWLSAEDSAGAAESTAAAREAEVAALRANPAAARSVSPGRFSPRVLVLILGLFVAVLSSMVSPLVALPVAGLVVLVALLLPVASPETAGTDDLLERARQAHAEAVRQAQQERVRADARGADVRSALGALDAPPIPEMTLARTHVDRVAELAANVTIQQRELSDLTTAEDTLLELEQDVVAARTALGALLAARGVTTEPSPDRFVVWVGEYEDTILAGRRFTAAEAHLEELEQRLTGLIAPVADELTGDSWPQRLARIAMIGQRLVAIESQEKRLREARLILEAVGDDHDQIERLRVECPDDVALEARLSEVQLRIAELDAARTRISGDVRELENQIEHLSEAEELAGLLDEQATILEDLAEATRSRTVLERAARILADAIERFEIENQAPAIKRAGHLLQRIVPDWGDIFLKHTTDGKVLLERRRGSTRLIDTRLSDGARSLMYLAMRLAFAADDTERRGVALPILCDDPLVHLDDTRRPGAIGLLADASRTNQVLLFTCDDATVALARDNGAHVVHL